MHFDNGEENSMEEQRMIVCENASVRLKGFHTQPVNLVMDKGFIYGLQGKNGSGKSTFIKMLLGRYPKMQGHIRIADLDVIENREQMLSKVGYVSEDRIFYGDKSVVEQEEIYSVFYSNWNHDIFEELLKKYQISKLTKYSALSKGNQIKFQLAFSMAYQPEVLILDEPMAGLDPVFRMDFVKFLQDIVAEYETTIVISSHLREELEKITDYMIVVDNGSYTCEEVLR